MLFLIKIVDQEKAINFISFAEKQTDFFAALRNETVNNELFLKDFLKKALR